MATGGRSRLGVRGRWRALAAVVSSGFGVDEEADDLGAGGFEGGLESGDGGVDVGHGEVVREGAVTGDLDAFGGELGGVA